MKKYIIKLSNSERNQLRNMTKKGTHGARVITRAHVLLESDVGVPDATIAEAHRVAISTVGRIRERYHDGGLHRAVYDAPRPGTPRVLDDYAEAHLVAIACSDPPEGHAHWTVELLRERLISDGTVTHIGIGTIHARLTERGLKPWREKNVVHPERNA
jgi:transposase